MVAAPAAIMNPSSSRNSEVKGHGLNVSEKAKDVRRSNITAAKAVADAIRTSLGPRGMDKMVQQETGSVLITNDGATILEQMHVEHPAAKMLVQLSRSQDVVAGDGTTSVVVICGSLLSSALDLLATGIHPSIISDSFQLALNKSLEIIKQIATPIDLNNRDDLIKAASTSLNSKVVSEYANLLAPIAVDAVLAIRNRNQGSTSNSVNNGNDSNADNVNGSSKIENKNGTANEKLNNGPNAASGASNITNSQNNINDINISTSNPFLNQGNGFNNVNSKATNDFVDLNNIRTVKVVGGTIDDTEAIDGLLLNQSASRGGSGAPTRVTNAKIALIQFCLSPPKTDIDNSIIIEDYTSMDRILREERQYLLGLCKKIKASGCNVVLIQKSILRDATTELSLHFLSKMKIMVVRDIERTEIEFISKSLGCIPIADISSFTSDKLSKCDLCEEIEFGNGNEKIIRITGINKPIKNTISILVRGSNQLVLDEAERSLHDALCVVRSIVHEQFLIPGGAAPETEVSVMLSKFAKSITGVKSHCLQAYAEALNVIAFTLAENAGLQPVDIVTELRRRHAAGESAAGINVRKGTVTNISDENVVMPLLVFSSALSLATECVRQLLKIDDVVLVR